MLEANLTTERTEDDGVSILSVAGTLPGNPNLADRTFLSYEDDSANQKFIIESRSAAAISSPSSENVFGDDLALIDTDFNFAWVDFGAGKTLSLPSIMGAALMMVFGVAALAAARKRIG